MEETMKKLFVPLSLVLLVFASAFAMADEGSTEDVSSEENRIFPHLVGPMQKLQHFMEEHGLTEDNTISDLLSALETEREVKLQEEMDAYGVDSAEELYAAKKAEHIEGLREQLGLSENATDREVLAAAKEARLDRMRDFLDLSEDASKKDIHAALQTWNEEHTGIRAPFGGAPHRRGGQ